MGYFRISGEGPNASGRSEKIVTTALEAEVQMHAMSRLCGRLGKVEVLGKDGRVISPDRLASMARAEEAAS